MGQPGIDALSFYVPQHYLPLSVLAAEQGIEPAKFSHGIGQDKLAMPGPDEDIVTLGAEAARKVLKGEDLSAIDTLLFATESGIDQSKAAGVFVHRLLGLPSTCRVVELKQACYSGTAALQLACGHVMRRSGRKVLVIAADIARYDLDSPAEATQGAGAVAMLVSDTPRLMQIEPISGLHSEDIMDFWRPNYRSTPLVDGKYSTEKYLETLTGAWRDYQAQGGHSFQEFAHFCYHLPFTRMGAKAHAHLSELAGADYDPARINAGLIYNRAVGNCYAAALYLSLASMLDNTAEDLSGQTLGLFSYGSGAVAEFFAAKVQPGYEAYLHRAHHAGLLANRTALSFDAYRTMWHRMWQGTDPQDGGHYQMPQIAKGQFRLTAIDGHKRCYAAG